MKVQTKAEIILEVCNSDKYKKVLESGTPEEQYKMAECFDVGKFYSPVRFHKISTQLYRKAADAGHVYASHRLYLNNTQKKWAFKYLKYAAENGKIISAKIQLANVYFITPKEYNKGFEIVKELATKKRNSVAIQMLAECYETGKGTAIDLEKAKYYYTKNNLFMNEIILKRLEMLKDVKNHPQIAKENPYMYKMLNGKLVPI
jgi:TPR repeat protein